MIWTTCGIRKLESKSLIDSVRFELFSEHDGWAESFWYIAGRYGGARGRAAKGLDSLLLGWLACNHSSILYGELE